MSRLFPMRRPAPRRLGITSVIVGAAVALGVVAAVDAFRSSNDEAAAPKTTTARDEGDNQPTATPTPADPDQIEILAAGSLSRVVGGIRFSLRLRTSGWERFGAISINKSIVGPQGAEAIIFWATFPDGDYADPCANLLRRPVGPSAASLAAAVATAPGTDLVTGPLDVTVGGRAAKHVVLTVRKAVGCKPGFFYSWQDVQQGALWPRTHVGDTIRVWIVKVGGTRLFLEAETNTQANPDFEREIERIVESIRFE
jgi:hypothetical protein